MRFVVDYLLTVILVEMLIISQVFINAFHVSCNVTCLRKWCWSHAVLVSAVNFYYNLVRIWGFKGLLWKIVEFYLFYLVNFSLMTKKTSFFLIFKWVILLGKLLDTHLLINSILREIGVCIIDPVREFVVPDFKFLEWTNAKSLEQINIYNFMQSVTDSFFLCFRFFPLLFLYSFLLSILLNEFSEYFSHYPYLNKYLFRCFCVPSVYYLLKLIQTFIFFD